MLVEPVHYVFLGVATFTALLWTLVSMGTIKLRSNDLHIEKGKHIEGMIRSIEETYSIMESIPTVNHGKIRKHLEDGEINKALEVARVHHDVYHFFKNN